MVSLVPGEIFRIQMGGVEPPASGRGGYRLSVPVLGLRHGLRVRVMPAMWAG